MVEQHLFGVSLSLAANMNAMELHFVPPQVAMAIMKITIAKDNFMNGVALWVMTRDDFKAARKLRDA
jgi:hypothetical protein